MTSSKNFISLIILVALFSCQKKVETLKNLESVVEFDLRDVQKHLVSEPILEVVDYITLETSEKSLIGSIDKLIVKEAGIYIMDKRNTSKIFLFNNTGEFIKTISSQGRGPGEYNFLQDFDVEQNGNVHILDSRASKITVLDKHDSLLYEKKINFFARSFQYLGNGNYLFYKKTKASDKQKEMNYNLILWNRGEGVYNKALPDRKILDHRSFVNLSRPSISATSSNVLFYRSFEYDFYEIGENDVRLKYSFDFGKKRIGESFFKIGDASPSAVTRALRTSNKVFAMSDYYETDQFFTTTFMLDREIYLFLYIKKSGHIKVKKFTAIAELELMLGINPQYADNGDVFGVIDSNFIPKMKKMLENGNKAQVKRIQNSQLEFVKKFPTTPNPIIVKYSFRDI